MEKVMKKKLSKRFKIQLIISVIGLLIVIIIVYNSINKAFEVELIDLSTNVDDVAIITYVKKEYDLEVDITDNKSKKSLGNESGYVQVETKEGESFKVYIDMFGNIKSDDYNYSQIADDYMKTIEDKLDIQSDFFYDLEPQGSGENNKFWIDIQLKDSWQEDPDAFIKDAEILYEDAKTVSLKLEENYDNPLEHINIKNDAFNKDMVIHLGRIEEENDGFKKPFLNKNKRIFFKTFHKELVQDIGKLETYLPDGIEFMDQSEFQKVSCITLDNYDDCSSLQVNLKADDPADDEKENHLEDIQHKLYNFIQDLQKTDFLIDRILINNLYIKDEDDNTYKSSTRFIYPVQTIENEADIHFE